MVDTDGDDNSLEIKVWFLRISGKGRIGTRHAAKLTPFVLAVGVIVVIVVAYLVIASPKIAASRVFGLGSIATGIALGRRILGR